MSKSKHSVEWRIGVVMKYLSAEGSYAVLAEEYGIGQTTLRDWVRRYKEYGEMCFSIKRGNKSYSRAFKIKCVEAVLSGSETVNGLNAIMLIWNSKIMNQSGRSIWQKHGEELR